MTARVPLGHRARERVAGPRAPAVDLADLAAQTGGDRALETEVLLLFQARSAVDFDCLKTADAEALRREAAHKIVGSARAIGAGEVARLAAAIESGGGDQASQMAELAAAIDEARRFISEYLSGSEKRSRSSG